VEKKINTVSQADIWWITNKNTAECGCCDDARVLYEAEFGLKSF